MFEELMNGLTRCLVLAGALAAGAPAPAAPLVTLAYKAADKPVEYWIRTTERVTRKRGDASAGRPEVDALVLTSQTRTATATGTIAVISRPHSVQAWANGEEIAPGEFVTGASSYAIRPDGSSVAEEPLTAESALTPVLPAGPVPLGHTWSVVVPASKKLPVGLTVTHVLQRVQVVDGVECAVIKSAGEAKGILKELGAPFVVKLEAETAIGLGDGLLLRARGERRLLVKRPNAPADELATYASRSVRVVQRKTAANPAPPDAPAP